MFNATMTIPQQSYEYVEKVNWEYQYDAILKKILHNNSYNKPSNVNNNIIGDYIMTDKEYVKSFTELYDVAHDRKIKLSKKIDFVVTSDEDGFYYTNQLYNIFIYGKTQTDAENNLFEELKFQYDSYAIENDNNLDSNAKKLKYNLLSLLQDNAKS